MIYDDRYVPREPRLAEVRGHNINENFPSGKLRPVGEELHL
jgi:hypothetical protein